MISEKRIQENKKQHFNQVTSISFCFRGLNTVVHKLYSAIVPLRLIAISTTQIEVSEESGMIFKNTEYKKKKKQEYKKTRDKNKENKNTKKTRIQ